MPTNRLQFVLGCMEVQTKNLKGKTLLYSWPTGKIELCVFELVHDPENPRDKA